MFLAFPSEKTSIVVLCNSGAEDAAAKQVAEVFLSSRMDRPPDPSPTSRESPAIDPTPVGAATPEKASEGDLVGDYESRKLRKTYSVTWSAEGFTIVADGLREENVEFPAPWVERLTLLICPSIESSLQK